MLIIYPDAIYYNAIIDILESKGKMTFNKLFEDWVNILRQTNIESAKHKKRKHSKSTKYTPSKSELSNILKKMVHDGYLKKEINESSKLMLKERNYALSSDARKLLQMKILKRDDRQPVFKRIYEVILLYNFVKTIYQKTIGNDLFAEINEKIPIPHYSMKTVFIDPDVELNDFVRKLNIQPEKLEWGLISFGNSEIEHILYPHHGEDPSNRPSKLQRQHFLDSRTKYLKENKDRPITHEMVSFICWPLKDRSVVDSWALNFWINRVETWEIKTANLDSKMISRHYTAYIPGVTIEEIVEQGSFTKSEVEQAISILQEFKLIRCIWFGNEIRYVLDDYQLNEFIETIKQIFVQEFLLLLTKWEEFEIPTANEKERMNWIFGPKEFKRISTNAEIRLHEHKTRLKKCNGLHKYMKLLAEERMADAVKPIEANKNNSILVQNNLKKRSAESINLSMFFVNEDYKQFRKEKGTQLRTERERIKDILEFSSYRKNKLNEKLERLDFNDYGYGIEIVKMEFNRILEMYPFLSEMLKMICPKVFEAPNEQEQNSIISDMEKKEQAKVELARRLDANFVDTGAALLVNMRGNKRKRKIPYSTKAFLDSRTGNIIVNTFIKL